MATPCFALARARVKHLDGQTTASSSVACCTLRWSSRAARVHIVVVHLGLLPGSRVRQIQQLHQFIEREVPAGAPVVVAGDFNDWG